MENHWRRLRLACWKHRKWRKVKADSASVTGVLGAAPASGCALLFWKLTLISEIFFKRHSLFNNCIKIVSRNNNHAKRTINLNWHRKHANVRLAFLTPECLHSPGEAIAPDARSLSENQRDVRNHVFHHMLLQLHTGNYHNPVLQYYYQEKKSIFCLRWMMFSRPKPIFSSTNFKIGITSFSLIKGIYWHLNPKKSSKSLLKNLCYVGS